MTDVVINNKSNYEKPILKWVGGKTQILDILFNEFPEEINNYHELFIGGGSVLFCLLEKIKQNIIKINGKINAYDSNEPLIYVYKNIKFDPIKLYDEIQKLINDYNNIIEDKIINRAPKNIEEAKDSKESYYYWIRKNYNIFNKDEKNSIIGSAYFIFLNKTGFRGIFRLNSKGEFNVPYGNYKNPEIINLEHITYISHLIQNVHFECLDYKESLNKTIENDFIYMDPPYAPENSKSFVSYTQGGFHLDEHIHLFQNCNKLNKENKKFIMNNSNVKLITDNFNDKDYNIKYIECKRTINSKNPSSKTKEVIIKNF
jgi:DNA adenine methylase